MSDPKELDPRYKNEILRALEYHFPGAKVILFGSRARGTNQPGSDVDIAVDAGKKIELGELARARATLENTTIPFFTDLVDLNRVPQELRKVIVKEGIVWKN